MPYLAFDLDALENCAAIAQGSGLRTEQVSHGLLTLWRHCWREKTDRISTGHLKAFFFGGDVVEMLLTFNLIAPTEAGPWRVRGAQKYLDISATRSANGQKAAANGNLKRGKAAPTASNKTESVSSSAPIEPQQPSNSAPVLSASSQQPAASSQKEEASFFAQQVFDHWLATTKKNANTTFTDARKRKVNARLAEGYSAQQLKDAIDGCLVTPHNLGETDGQIHDDLELICRSAGQVDRFIRNKASPPQWKKPRAQTADPNQDFPQGILHASPL